MVGDIILYSTNCPKCAVLEKKLQAKNIPYVKIQDVKEMSLLGIRTVPMLKIGDGPLLDFTEAVRRINLSAKWR